MALQQGMNQQTPAIQHKIAKAMGGMRRSGGKRRVKRSRKAVAPRRAKRRASGRVRLKKGSAAAKAWGRKMKALRKRR